MFIPVSNSEQNLGKKNHSKFFLYTYISRLRHFFKIAKKVFCISCNCSITVFILGVRVTKSGKVFSFFRNHVYTKEDLQAPR